MRNKKALSIMAMAAIAAILFFLAYSYPTGFITGFSKLPLQERNSEISKPENSSGAQVSAQTKKSRFYEVGEVNITNGRVASLLIEKEV